MSYSIRALSGGEAFELPDFVGQPSVSYELSATGSLKATYAKVGVNASHIMKPDTILEVRYKNQQLYDSSFIIQDGDDPNESQGTNFTIVARSLHDLFRRTVVRNPDGPAKPLIYEDVTIGYILVQLLTQAQARGALQGITWDFTETLDSYGSPWLDGIWREYKPGTKYEAVFQDWFESYGVSLRFLGNKLEVYMEENFGRDLTTPPNLVEFIAGVDYEETPKKWSVKDRAKYSLILGEEGIYNESTGDAPLGPYGREEQSISQGSIKEEGMLTYINQASLKMVSKNVREEYTRKIAFQPGRPIAGLDYRVGDRVRERVGSRSSEPLRILSLVLELPYDGSTGSASVVYNDRLLDSNGRIGRIISRLSGGTSSTGTTGPKDTDSPPPDITPPAAPNPISIDTYSYRGSDGVMQGVAALDWPDVSSNIDGTPADDISHYEYRWKTATSTPAEMPETLSPAEPFLELNAKWDRRDKPFGWIGGDGAASVRLNSGKDWWIFGDSSVGTMDSTWKINGPWGMVNNALVETDPADPDHFRTLIGQTNLLPENWAVPSEVMLRGNIRTDVSLVGEGMDRALRVVSVPDETNSSGWVHYAGEFDLPEGTTQVTVRCQYRTSPGATTAGFGPIQYSETGAHVSSTAAALPASEGWTDWTYVENLQPETGRFSPFVRIQNGEWVEVRRLAFYVGDQRHQSWSIPAGKNWEGVLRPEAAGWKSLEYQNYARNMARTLEAEEATVAVLGDSLTRDPAGYLPALQTLVSGEFWANDTLTAPATPVETIREALASAAFWADVVAMAPNHGLAVFGANDYPIRTAAEFAQDVADLAARWATEVPGKGLTIALWPETLDAPITRPFSEYATQARSALAGNDLVNVVDLDQYVHDKVWVNLSPNPSAEVGDSTWALYTNTTRQRITGDGTAWVGDSYMRFTLLAAGSNAMMHYPVEAPVGESTQVARFRIRGSRNAQMNAGFRQYKGGAGNGLSGESVAIQVTDQWQEITLPPFTSAADSNRLGVMFTKAGAWQDGDTVEVDGFEIYKGPDLPPVPYMDGGNPPDGWATIWEGAANSSASRGVPLNWTTDGVTPNTAGADRLASAIFDRLQNPLSDYYWLGDGWTANDKVYVQAQIIGPHWPTPDGWNFTYKGRADLAVFDSTSGELLEVRPWITSTTSWTNAVYEEGNYAYVFGHLSDSSACVLRVPLTDPFASAEAWNGNAWVTDLEAAAPLIQGQTLDSIRKLDGVYHAYWIESFSTHVSEATAPALTGPWTVQTDPVYRVPEVSGEAYAYIVRQHEQFDTMHGLAFGYSQNTLANWIEEGLMNAGPRFARGPEGKLGVGDLTTRPWAGISVSKDSNGSVSPLLINTSVYAEVRTIDNAGNASPWNSSSAVVVSQDLTPPQAPSTPKVTPFFQGIRVEWDGLDDLGNTPPPEWKHLEVHVSEINDFYPTQETLVEVITAHGTVPAMGLKPDTFYYAKMVAVNKSGTRSEPSEQGWAVTNQLVNADLPDKLVEGAKIADEAINATHLTVSAFGGNLLRNSNVEEWDGDLPFGMKEYWWGDNSIIPSKGDPIGGTASFQVTVPPGTTDGREWQFAPVPVIERKLYYFSAEVMTSAAVEAGAIRLFVATGATPGDCNGFNGAFEAVINDVQLTNEGVGAAVTVESSFEVPEGCRWAAVVTSHVSGASQASTVVVNWDNFRLSEIIGGAEIAYGQIHTAHISYLDLNAGNVGKLNVGNLAAGIMTADVTISNRFKTADSGQRFEINPNGARGYRADGAIGTEMTNSGSLISRDFRTNTNGTRIEMGTYAIGESSALMSFFPDSGAWQFPPAIGFGGDARKNINVEGIAIHAGSVSETLYQKHGMNMIGVDQVGGIGMITGNLLDGSQATEGADITIDAGGNKGIVRVTSGGVGGAQDRAELILSPRRLGDNRTDIPYSKLDLWYGTLNFAPSPYGNYNIRFVDAGEWGGWPKNHLLLTANSFRFQTGGVTEAFTIDNGGDVRNKGVYRGSGWNEAARIKTGDSTFREVEIRWNGTHFGMIAYDSSGNQVAAQSFVPA